MSERVCLPIMYQTGIDRAIDTRRTELFDLTDPFTQCRDAIAGPDQQLQSRSARALTMSKSVSAGQHTQAGSDNRHKLLQSLQDEMVKNSKEAAAMYRYMCKDKYRHKNSDSLR